MPKQHKNTTKPAPTPDAKPSGTAARTIKGSVIPHARKVQWQNATPDALDAALADVLLSADHTLQSVCHENQLADRWNTKWARLNPGMQRMNLGNVLRGKLRREERVVVAGAVIR